MRQIAFDTIHRVPSNEALEQMILRLRELDGESIAALYSRCMARDKRIQFDPDSQCIMIASSSHCESAHNDQDGCVALSRKEWESLWEVFATFPTTSLSHYAEMIRQEKSEWHQRYPYLSFDDARYVFHLEDCLSKKIPVPQQFIDDVSDHEMQHNIMDIPLLLSRKKQTNNEKEKKP